MTNLTQPPATPGTLAPSLVRTLVPFLAGLLGTYLLDEFGLALDSTTATALATAGIGYAYYVIVRFLEVFGSSKWGYILGVPRPPGYDAGPPAAGDRGAANPLTAIGAVLVLLGVVAIIAGLVESSMVLVFLGVVALVIGGVILARGPRTRASRV